MESVGTRGLVSEKIEGVWGLKLRSEGCTVWRGMLKRKELRGCECCMEAFRKQGVVGGGFIRK